jgi:phospholipid transport system substrate-binding protein
MKRTISGFVSTIAAAAVSVCVFGSDIVFAQSPPDALVKAVTMDVTAALKADPTIINSAGKLSSIIEGKLAPNFNFSRMAQVAMGRNWAKASPEQQAMIASEFKSLLVRTYSGALSNYRNNTVDFKPLRLQPTDTDALVRTVIQAGGSPVPIDYSMEKSGDTWKAYDITVAGVSLVTNYREEFNNIVRDQGVDGLIKQLQQKNKG